jgi:hypothetical protein
MKLLIPFLFFCLNLTAQSWMQVEDLPGFITDIEIHNGERYITYKSGEVIEGSDTIKYYPVQLFSETGLLSLCWWQDSLCVVASGLDSIQRVICGTDTLCAVSYKNPWSIRHRAGDMVAADSILYVAFGDGSYPDAAQDTSDFRGKILAITSDTITLVAYGLRNPWKIDLVGDSMYVSDVGDRDEEEINRFSLDSVNLHGPVNLGWPCYEGYIQHDTTCSDVYFPFFTYPRAQVGNAIIGGKYFNNAFWWCDNYYRFGGMSYDNGNWDKIPCPQYPDGMYVQGDSILVYDYTGKIYLWTEGPLSLDSIPPKEKPINPKDLVITNDLIKWNRRFENCTFMVLTVDNKIITYMDASFKDEIPLGDFIPGVYVLVLMTPHGVQWSKLFTVI